MKENLRMNQKNKVAREGSQKIIYICKASLFKPSINLFEILSTSVHNDGEVMIRSAKFMASLKF